jgi:outer membrane receptor for Fe3+-dicitrate
LETEYTKNQLSAFFNVSGSQTAYQRVDYFKKDSSGNAQKTPWVNFSGYTLKTGANYNFTRKFNTFVNLGYLNRPTRFNNVFDNRNTQIQDAKNEIVYALEGGSGYKNKRIALNLNAYYTLWENRPVDFQPTFRDADDNPLTYNINGLKARHMGAELQAAIKAGDGITLEFSLAAGDWIWRSGSNATVRNDAGDSIGQFSFDAAGVHVGDAAQNQVAGLIRWEPTYLKGAYFSLQYVYFGKHFADFEPIALRGDMAGKESFKIPNYWYMNFNGGYAFDLKNSVKVRLYFNISNMTNNLYISDAQHRSTVGDIGNPTEAPRVFNPRNLEVFVSQGLRYTTGIRVSF